MRAMILGAVLALTFVGTPVLAQDAGTNKAVKANDVEALLKQLGADDYDAREAATMALVKKGKSALPAIKKLYAKTNDPEVKNRCAFIIKKLEGAPKTPKSVDRSKGLKQAPGNQAIPGLPDMNDLFKDMQLPEGFKKIFEGMQGEIQKELQKSLQDMLNPNGNKGQGNKPRVKVFRFGTKPGGGQGLVPMNPNRTKVRRSHATGLATKPLDNVLKTHLQLKGNGGVVVTKVKENSWGAQSGLKLHDIVLKINGEGVTSLDDLDVLFKKEGKAEIIRGGKKMELTLPKRKAPAKKDDRDF